LRFGHQKPRSEFPSGSWGLLALCSASRWRRRSFSSPHQQAAQEGMGHSHGERGKASLLRLPFHHVTALVACSVCYRPHCRPRHWVRYAGAAVPPIVIVAGLISRLLIGFSSSIHFVRRWFGPEGDVLKVLAGPARGLCVFFLPSLLWPDLVLAEALFCRGLVLTSIVLPKPCLRRPWSAEPVLPELRSRRKVFFP